MTRHTYQPPPHAARSTATGWLLLAPGAWAHGEAQVRNPWLDGAQALFGDPPSLLVLAALALWCVQQGAARAQAASWGSLVGLLAGACLAGLGWAVDATWLLLALTLLLGLGVAWARTWPAPLVTSLAAVVCGVVVLMLAPSPAEKIGFRLVWLVSVAVVLAVVLAAVLGSAYTWLRTAQGRQPGPVQQLLLRVAGSWLATAALLVLVLEMQARAG